MIKFKLFFCIVGVLFLISCIKKKGNILKTDTSNKELLPKEKKDSNLLATEINKIEYRKQNIIERDSAFFCDIKKIVALNENINYISKKNIIDFLKTFDVSCHDNIEYKEYSNETLFKLLEKKPIDFIDILASDLSLDSNLILNELSQPVHDGIEIEKLLLEIKNIQTKNIVMKNKIEEMLTKAFQKNN